MSTTVIINSAVPAGALAALASDAGATGVLDVGDGTGLSAGDGSALASGLPAYRALNLETLGGANHQSAAAADPSVSIEARAGLCGASPSGAEASATARSNLIASGEGLFSRRGGSPVLGESLRRSTADVAAAAEIPALFLLDPALPIEPNSVVPTRPAPAPVESGARLIGNRTALAEGLNKTRGIRVTAHLSLRIEGRRSVRRQSDATLPVETSRSGCADAAVIGEAWGTYVVQVTLTLADGRVLVYAAKTGL